MTYDLARLLAPVDVQTFLEQHWETTPLLVRRDNPDYFAGMPGLDDLDELITTTAARRTRLDHEDGRIVRTNKDGSSSQHALGLDRNGIPDIADVYRSFHRGYSIVIDQVHCRSSAVAGLCNSLEAALHHRVGANMYLTPRSGQGFRPHIDTHDVLVLQLHGTKEWHVAPPTADLPLASRRASSSDPLAGFTVHELNPGDVFYLPRGYWHEAVTTSSSSLHLTVGIHVTRWTDLLAVALDLVGDDIVELRTAMSPGYLDRPIDAGHLAKIVDRLAESLTADPALAERARDQLGGRLVRDSKAADRSRVRSIDALAGLTLDSELVRPDGILCRVTPGPARARIEFLGTYVSRSAEWVETLRYVAGVERFRVRDLPGELSDDDRLDLVRDLVAEGLLLLP